MEGWLDRDFVVSKYPFLLNESAQNVFSFNNLSSNSFHETNEIGQKRHKL